VGVGGDVDCVEGEGAGDEGHVFRHPCPCPCRRGRAVEVACLREPHHAPSRQLAPALAPAQHATLHLGSQQRTHLFQHDLGIFEVIEHGLDVGLVGGPGHKAPGDSLHALHGARRQQLRAPRASRSARADEEEKKSGGRVAQRRQ
jgi:hypothetical protein